MDIEVTNAPELSVGEPPSVPSRISVVLVEETKAGGTPRLGCPREDQDIRLLAGVAKPASVTVCIGGDAVLFRHCRETPSGGTCWTRMARMLQVALLARLGHCPPLTLLALTARMLQGALLAQMGRCPHLSCWPVCCRVCWPYGTLSPFNSDPAGPDGLYVAGGPVGPFGTLSPSDSGCDTGGPWWGVPFF